LSSRVVGAFCSCRSSRRRDHRPPCPPGPAPQYDDRNHHNDQQHHPDEPDKYGSPHRRRRHRHGRPVAGRVWHRHLVPAVRASRRNHLPVAAGGDPMHPAGDGEPGGRPVPGTPGLARRAVTGSHGAMIERRPGRTARKEPGDQTERDDDRCPATPPLPHRPSVLDPDPRQRPERRRASTNHVRVLKRRNRGLHRWAAWMCLVASWR